MNTVLRLHELLFQIFDALPAKRDVVRCCLTCKSFYGPAVEVLWKEVSLSDLLSQFPDDVLSVYPGRLSSNSRFMRYPETATWEKVIQRGTLIKHLHHAARGQISRGSPIRPSVFPTLGFARPVFQLLPYLEKLEWFSTQYSTEDETDFFIFLSPSIRELSFHLNYFSQLFIRETIARIEPSKLQILDLQFWSVDADSAASVDALWSLGAVLPSLGNLRSLKMDVDLLVMEDFVVMGTLPLLGSIELTGSITAFLPGCEEEPPDRLFPSLEMLCFKSPMTDCYEFLDLFRDAPLRFIAITCSNSDAFVIRNLFEGIAQRWPALRSLDCKPSNTFYRFITQDSRMADVYEKPHRVGRIERSLIGLKTLYPLLQLRQLEELIFEWPYALRINSADLELMIKSWPDIRRLYLAPIPFFILPERPPIRLESLALLQKATHLSRLAMFIDAAIVEGDVVPARYVATHDEGTARPLDFDPGRSWINQPDQTASTLRALFPGICMSGLAGHRTAWGDVARILRNQP